MAYQSNITEPFDRLSQVVDVKGLQYVTNLLSSHPGLYLDVKQVEGKYKARQPLCCSITRLRLPSERVCCSVCRCEC